MNAVRVAWVPEWTDHMGEVRGTEVAPRQARGGQEVLRRGAGQGGRGRGQSLGGLGDPRRPLLSWRWELQASRIERPPSVKRSDAAQFPSVRLVGSSAIPARSTLAPGAHARASRPVTVALAWVLPEVNRSAAAHGLTSYRRPASPEKVPEMFQEDGVIPYRFPCLLSSLRVRPVVSALGAVQPDPFRVGVDVAGLLAGQPQAESAALGLELPDKVVCGSSRTLPCGLPALDAPHGAVGGGHV